MAESHAYDLPTPDLKPSPFLKWVGGKSGLMSQFESVLPTDFNRYHEPFVGGGAMFFRLNPGAGNARISDFNGRLIETYTVIRDALPELIQHLERHRARHCKEYYYRQRQRMNAPPRGLDEVGRAALFIYLNKTCFNGLYRENLSGEFNVPMGKYKKPKVLDVDGLVAASHALQGIEIEHASFDSVLDHAEPGDFVYFDPPYVPVSATSNFTSYTKNKFDEALQIRLAQTFDRLARRGCYVMLSNSDCDFVRELYAGWRTVDIRARRNINSNAKKRGKVGEVAVLSW